MADESTTSPLFPILMLAAASAAALYGTGSCLKASSSAADASQAQHARYGACQRTWVASAAGNAEELKACVSTTKKSHGECTRDLMATQGKVCP